MDLLEIIKNNKNFKIIENEIFYENKKLKEDDFLLYDPNYRLEILDDYRNANYKFIIINYKGFYIFLNQNHKLNKGGIFWDGSYILMAFLDDYFLKENKKMNIIELGAGTSVPSIYLSKLEHNILSTDINKLLPLIQINYKLNSLNLEQIIECEWNNKTHLENCLNKIPKYDIIICSELIYLKYENENLINTLLELSKNSSPYIIFTYKIRLIEVIEDFFINLEKKFSIKTIDNSIIQNYQKCEEIYLKIACIDKVKLNQLKIN